MLVRTAYDAFSVQKESRSTTPPIAIGALNQHTSASSEGIDQPGKLTSVFGASNHWSYDIPHVVAAFISDYESFRHYLRRGDNPLVFSPHTSRGKYPFDLYDSANCQRRMRSSINFANPTESATTVNTRGDDRVMFCSRASRTAAMIEAQIARVEAKRSVLRCSSSRAFARRISPMQTMVGENLAKMQTATVENFWPVPSVSTGTASRCCHGRRS